MSLRIEHTLRLKKYDEIWQLNIHQLVDDVDFPSYKPPLSPGEKNALPPPSAHKHARPEAKHLAVQQRPRKMIYKWWVFRRVFHIFVGFHEGFHHQY